MSREPTDPQHSPTGGRDKQHEEEHDLADSESAEIHRGTEDVAPGVIKDGHAEIQPDPYPDGPEHAGHDGPDRDVIEQHRADAHEIETQRTSAANETLGTVVEHDEFDTDETDG